ncbi:MAG: hypothetical protein IJ515_05835 [Clostridia bacterium]|nr:hypothetical protein [Clostridia bacterium]
MKKQELLDLLNKAADSINLHDASMYGFKWINSTVEFIICLGSYHYIINELEELVDDVNNRVVLTLKFDGIENVECEFCEDFRYDDAEIMENNQLENGTFEFVFLECGNPGKISFRYTKFEWDVVGEFDYEQIKQWCKENGL